MVSLQKRNKTSDDLERICAAFIQWRQYERAKVHKMWAHKLRKIYEQKLLRLPPFVAKTNSKECEITTA